MVTRNNFTDIPEKLVHLFSDLQFVNTADEDGDKDRLFVNALARGLELLRCFKPEVRALGTQDFARIIGLPNATAYRLAHTLTKLGYLTHSSETGKYQLAAGVLSFSNSYLKNMDVIQVARPFMQDLADQAHTSVYLAVRDRLDMVLLASCKDPNTNFNLNLQVTDRLPLAKVSLGRAFLCALPEDERNYLMDHIRRQNEQEWPETKAAIEQALKNYDRWGFCLSIGGWRQDVNAVGTAVNPGAGTRMLTLNCAGPSFQLRQHMIEDEIGPRLLHTARILETELSFISL